MIRATADSGIRSQSGSSSLEAIVSFTLLSSVLTFATPLVIKHGRLMSAQRDYRLALDEVSNQLERLTTLPDNTLAEALKQLAPSDLVADKLSNAALRGEMESIDSGRRLTVRLSWNAQAESSATVALAAWIPPARSAASAERGVGHENK